MESVKIIYLNASEVIESFKNEHPEYKDKELTLQVSRTQYNIICNGKSVEYIVASKGEEFKENNTRVYGYARVSTLKQSIERQIDNIKKLYPEAIIFSEAYTGTKIERPVWSKLERQLKAGDVVVFDEVSRMSRNAEEGFKLYKELYDRGVNLVFIKESTLNTDNFRKTAQISLTGNEVDVILEGVNKYLMILAENQIKSAFATAQHEVDFLHQRTSEGVRRAQAQGKRVGQEQGAKLTTKKSLKTKIEIIKHSKDFNGTLKDNDAIKLIGVAHNSYYKYKSELKEELAKENIKAPEEALKRLTNYYELALKEAEKNRRG